MLILNFYLRHLFVTQYVFVKHLLKENLKISFLGKNFSIIYKIKITGKLELYM